MTAAVRARTLRRGKMYGQRKGARAYIGGQRELRGPNCCPVCHKQVSVTPNGNRRSHRDDATGEVCCGSRMFVQRPVTLSVVPPVTLPTPPVPPSRDPDKRRIASHGRWRCPDCGRNLAARSDGLMRNHRVTEYMASPRCEGSLKPPLATGVAS